MNSIDGDNHNKWYRVCPGLPFSYCLNLLVTLIFVIFLPAILVLGPLIAILLCTTVVLPSFLTRNLGCIGITIVYVLCILLLMPLSLAIGMAVALIVDVVVIVPLYLLSISFLIRLIVVGCQTKL